MIQDKIKQKYKLRFTVLTELRYIFFCILGLIRAQEILKLEPDIHVYLRKMENHPEMLYRMFIDMKDKKEYRVVLDCKTSNIFSILQKVSL